MSTPGVGATADPAAMSASTSGHRRMLLVSYCFPPNPAVGSLRWEQLAAMAVERGWTVDVLTAAGAGLPHADPSRLSALPTGVTVHEVTADRSLLVRAEHHAAAVLRTLRALRGRRIRGAAAPSGGTADPEPQPAQVLIDRDDVRWGLDRESAKRAYLSLRDLHQDTLWSRAAVRAATALMERWDYDLVVSSGPPHSCHDAAREIGRRGGLPLVVDHRDAWSVTPVLRRDLASPVWLRGSRKREARVSRAATLVVANTPALEERLVRDLDLPRERVLTVLNGFDDVHSGASARTRFEVVYAGNIYIDRNPRVFFAAARRLIESEGLSPDDVSFVFVGGVQKVQGQSLESVAAQEGVGPYVSVRPRMPRAQLLEFLAGASVLLSLPQGVDLAIPSKIFEYMQFPAWVLVMATRGSATEAILRGSEADVVEPDDVDALAAVLRHRYRQYRAGERPRPLAELQPRFSRRAQGARLMDALDTIVPTSAI